MKHILTLTFSIIMAIGLCSCGKEDGNVQPVDPGKKEDGLTVFKFASYNVKCDTNDPEWYKSWSKGRKNLVLSLLKQRNFDVCGFCEVTLPTIKDDLVKALGDGYSFVIRGRGENTDKGEAVGFCYNRSKFNLLKDGYFYLNSHPDTPGEATEWYSPEPEKPYNRSRIAVWGLLEDKKEKTRFIYISSHFELNEGMREGSANLIIKKAKEFNADGTPVFFCGDLNAQPTEKISIGLLSKYFVDSYDEAKRENLPREGNVTTYNGFNKNVGKANGKRIDYLFYRGDSVVLKKYGVIYDLIEDELPSDHFPIYIEVSFKAVE